MSFFKGSSFNTPVCANLFSVSSFGKPKITASKTHTACKYDFRQSSSVTLAVIGFGT